MIAPAGYTVDRRTVLLERKGFKVTEFELAPDQQIPWHCHTHVQDTFYVVEGVLQIFARDPKEQIRLEPGQTYSMRARRPHLVTNGGDRTVTFVILQGIGDYDFVPLT